MIVSVRPVGSQEAVWSTRLAWREGEWQVHTLPLDLPVGEYTVAFDAEATWSNPGQLDRRLPPENRALGFAVSSLCFT
ncbi:MAG: hypothetical protein ABR992_19040 [Solirubrobacteraceae bacterium]